ncbi:MAG: histidine phosphatase family protein [Desulfovibrionaceae bacterium]
MSVCLLRHGALAPNPQRRFIGAQDIPLSPQGVGQAQLWGQCWARQEAQGGQPLAGIVCSNLSRCLETAQIIARAIARGGARHGDVPVYADECLRELCLGDWAGLTPAEVEALFPGQYAARGKDMAHFCPPHGESFADLARRVLPAFDHWQDHFRKAPWLLVGHAGTNRVILARHMALPLSQILNIPQPYACSTQLEGA